MKKFLSFIIFTMSCGALYAGNGGPKWVDSIGFTRDGTTQTTAASAGSGSSIYNATSTAGFPLGASFSTATFTTEVVTPKVRSTGDLTLISNSASNNILMGDGSQATDYLYWKNTSGTDGVMNYSGSPGAFSLYLNGGRNYFQWGAGTNISFLPLLISSDSTNANPDMLELRNGTDYTKSSKIMSGIYMDSSPSDEVNIGNNANFGIYVATTGAIRATARDRLIISTATNANINEGNIVFSLNISTSGGRYGYIGLGGNVANPTNNLTVAGTVGVYYTATTTPTCTCGTGCTVYGTDHKGIVVYGSPISQTCKVTFQAVHFSTPSCQWTYHATATLPWYSVDTPTGSTLTVQAPDTLGGVFVSYDCEDVRFTVAGPP